MGLVFNTQSSMLSTSRSVKPYKKYNQEISVSTKQSVKPLTLRNRIFLKSLGIFN